MNPYCATGPRCGFPHHWQLLPREVDTPTKLSEERGRCRDCGLSRTFTNAYRKGPYAGGTAQNWATVHADAAEYGRRMAVARAGRAAKKNSE